MAITLSLSYLMTKICYFLKFADTTLIFATIVNIGINKVIMLFYIYMRTKNNSVHLTSKCIHIYPQYEEYMFILLFTKPFYVFFYVTF